MLKLSPEQRSLALTEAANYKYPDAFASDMLLSSAFLDPEDENAQPDLRLTGELVKIWKVINLPFREYLTLLQRTQTTLSRRFAIPARTVRSWALNERQCPSYLRIAMAEADGVFDEPVGKIQ